MTNICKKFKKIDKYGINVGVNYRGDGAFKTNCGACLTILTFITIGLYSLTRMIQMFNRET